MAAYYNEVDPFAAQWLRNLIAAGHIAAGEVDERDIRDVSPTDLVRFRQCHFFAGIGGWSRALRLAGIPDDEPVWTGSCPCQPFSGAGKRLGTADSRHLWPQFRRLIGERKPAKVFGEQVASRDGRTWLASVFADLEKLGYAAAGADLCAAGVGAPQIRARLWWVADADDSRWKGAIGQRQPDKTGGGEWPPSCCEPVRPIGRHWPPGPREVDAIPMLANGLPGTMGACKAYGNAIVPQVAAEFIKATL